MKPLKAQILTFPEDHGNWFPYTVFLTRDEWPFGKVRGVASTKFGARLIARRELKRAVEVEARGNHIELVEEVTL